MNLFWNLALNLALCVVCYLALHFAFLRDFKIFRFYKTFIFCVLVICAVFVVTLESNRTLNPAPHPEGAGVTPANLEISGGLRGSGSHDSGGLRGLGRNNLESNNLGHIKIEGNILENLDSIFHAFASLENIATTLFLTTLLILSLLDSKNLAVPSILLVFLFALSVFIYVARFGDFLPFGFLGATYFFYFLLHIFSHKELLGQGDVWVISSIATFLESSPQKISLETTLKSPPIESALLPIYVIILAGVLGIIYALFKDRFLKARFSKTRIWHTKIPFIPFLSLGFIIIGFTCSLKNMFSNP